MRILWVTCIYHAVLRKEFEHPWICISTGILEPISHGCWGTVVFTKLQEPASHSAESGHGGLSAVNSLEGVNEQMSSCIWTVVKTEINDAWQCSFKTFELQHNVISCKKV